MSAPALRVLDTYELLENILVRLSLRNIFVLQSVTSTWRDLIQRSKKIQVKMFRVATGDVIEPGKGEFGEVIYHANFRINPLVHISYGTYGRNDSRGTAKYFADSKLVPRGTYGPNPRIIVLLVLEPAALQGCKDILEMFLTQPPITEMRHSVMQESPDAWGSDDSDLDTQNKTTRNPTGLKIRDLVHAKVQMDDLWTLRLQPLSSPSVQD